MTVDSAQVVFVDGRMDSRPSLATGACAAAFLVRSMSQLTLATVYSK